VLFSIGALAFVALWFGQVLVARASRRHLPGEATTDGSSR
jgi:hypothetical protein